MKSKNGITYIAQAGVIAALYVALTYISAAFNLAYGPFQIRLSEMLTILPVFTPAAIPGLVIGCVIGNLGSPLGIVDIIFGSVATLIAAILTRSFKPYKIKGLPVLSALPPIIVNALVIGLELYIMLPAYAGLIGFAYGVLSVAAGQLIACLGLGLVLYVAIEKSGVKKSLHFES
ncbi:MAG TPA: QueT transporter family protein [Clostridiales bacterium]|nr:QueT transporter family protein [Clostridiales bacterium]HOJ35205.1 QueT transporter family protein [Clostridiales bacterium]HOL79100.1 QueT transporter family protein [Clostridiales bacterium]HPP68743.1 QueT transporter family protein [Clostridiales bacterium]HQA05262.1 QueT transporter family protein [Clostridiales bacterium]